MTSSPASSSVRRHWSQRNKVGSEWAETWYPPLSFWAHTASWHTPVLTHDPYLAGWGISTSSLRLVLAPSGVPGDTQWDLCPQRGSLIEEENRKQDHQINTTNTTDQTHLINAKIRGQIFEKKNGPSLVFQIFSQYTYQLKEKNSNFTGEKFSLQTQRDQGTLTNEIHCFLAKNV